MSRLYKILLLIPLVSYVLVYGLSEYRLKAVTFLADFKYGLLTDQQTLQKGEHIVRTRGCFGCHGQKLEGRIFTDQWPWVDRAVAPNLAAYAKAHDVKTYPSWAVNN